MTKVSLSMAELSLTIAKMSLTVAKMSPTLAEILPTEANVDDGKMSLTMVIASDIGQWICVARALRPKVLVCSVGLAGTTTAAQLQQQRLRGLQERFFPGENGPTIVY